MLDYWAFVAPAVRERLGEGASTEQAARDVIVSPEYSSSRSASGRGPSGWS